MAQFRAARGTRGRRGHGLAQPHPQRAGLGAGPLTSGDDLNGHPDLALPEPFEDLPEVAGPQLPAERELLPRSLPLSAVRQGLRLALGRQGGAVGAPRRTPPALPSAPRRGSPWPPSGQLGGPSSAGPAGVPWGPFQPVGRSGRPPTLCDPGSPHHHAEGAVGSRAEAGGAGRGGATFRQGRVSRRPWDRLCVRCWSTSSRRPGKDAVSLRCSRPARRQTL